jgi:hypothetical protein
MEERIRRIERIRTDFFFVFLLETRTLESQKSVRIRPIRPIRSPIVSPLSKTKSLKINLLAHERASLVPSLSKQCLPIGNY